jgi:hypothetical protein
MEAFNFKQSSVEIRDHREKPQVPPLRFAPVGMTNFLQNLSKERFVQAGEASSKPKKSSY